MRTLIHNATVVDENASETKSVVIADDKISDIIGKENDNQIDINAFDEVIDASGMVLLPGVIDDHVHFREPGLTQKADIESESRAAAAGGVTSYMDMPNTKPHATTLPLLENKFKLAEQKSRVNYSFYYGATNDNIDSIASLDPTTVCGVKVFMGSSTGGMLVDKESSLRQLFAASPLLIMAHCEDTGIINDNIKHFKKKYKGQNDFPVRYHSRIRNTDACFASSSLAVRLAKETGARLHVAHISTAKELSLFSPGQVDNKKITAEAVIPHLMFTNEDYDLLGTKIKCNPAIKSVDDRNALRQALADKVIDIVATDHAPHLAEEKKGGALNAMSGMPSIQFSLVSMLNLVDEGVITMQDVVRLMCHNPARLFRIDRRGFIKEGFYADLVLVKKDRPWVLTNDMILSKCKWSPFEGSAFNWKVARTIVNGETVFSEHGLNDNVRGKSLAFNA